MVTTAILFKIYHQFCCNFASKLKIWFQVWSKFKGHWNFYVKNIKILMNSLILCLWPKIVISDFLCEIIPSEYWFSLKTTLIYVWVLTRKFQNMKTGVWLDKRANIQTTFVYVRNLENCFLSICKHSCQIKLWIEFIMSKTYKRHIRCIHVRVTEFEKKKKDQTITNQT